MIWLWLISSSLALAAALQAATVSGSVILENSREASVRRQKDYSGVVLALTRLGSPTAERPPRQTAARMDQRNKTFVPHILAIEVGTTVEFPNNDPIFHNAFSNYDGQIFDLGLYPPGTSRKVTFRRSGVVRVFCNIHASMSAVIVVLDTPWFAVTPASGQFAIHAVPPGEYVLRVFHERAVPSTLQALERRVTVGGSDVALGVIRVSEAGYLVVPHTNKYGKPYDPHGEDLPLYPATRK